MALFGFHDARCSISRATTQNDYFSSKYGADGTTETEKMGILLATVALKGISNRNSNGSVHFHEYFPLECKRDPNNNPLNANARVPAVPKFQNDVTVIDQFGDNV